jgi:hypothetical protein
MQIWNTAQYKNIKKSLILCPKLETLEPPPQAIKNK